MKIILLQKRGLGNQLFQYAAALYFAKVYEADLEIITEPTDKAWSADRPRPCLLSKFSLSVPLRTSTVQEPTESDRIFDELHGSSPNHEHYRQPDCETWLFLPELPINPRSPNVYIEGFFEAYRFCDIVEEQLRKDLVLLEAPSGLNANLLASIQRCRNSVSIHLRRGDYAVECAGDNLLPMTYYSNAIAVVRKSVPTPTFFVFSDDIGFARKHLSSDRDVVFVDHNGEADAHEDLRLMSACHHHIIANSTFSWWGAWINPSKEKLVLAPDRWRKHCYPRESEIIPPEWIRIPADSPPGFSGAHQQQWEHS